MTDHAFEQCIARGELPARESLGDDVFQKRADECSPENGGTEIAARETSRREIAGTDAGRGNEQARADDGEQSP